MSVSRGERNERMALTKIKGLDIDDSTIFANNMANDPNILSKISSNTIYYSGGNIGIGIASPSSVFEVYKNLAGEVTLLTLHKHESDIDDNSKINIDFVFTDNNGNGIPQARIQAHANTDKSSGAGREAEGTGDLVFFTASAINASTSNLAEKMRITSTGNIGIGTSSPGAKISLGAYSINNETPSSADQVSHIRLYESGSSYYGFGVSTNALNIAANQSSGRIRFWVNGTERVRIDSSGNVGIGTTSPSQRLTVSGNIKLESGSIVFRHTEGPFERAVMYATGSDANGMRLVIDSGGPTIVGSGESGTTTSPNVSVSSKDLYLVSDSHIRLISGIQNGWSSRVEAITILNSGNVGIGVTSPGVRLDVNGVVRATGMQVGSNQVFHAGNYKSWHKGISLTIPAGQKEVTWSHQYGSSNYFVAIGSQNTSRHIAWKDKTNNDVKFFIDSEHDSDINFDVILLGY